MGEVVIVFCCFGCPLMRTEAILQLLKTQTPGFLEEDGAAKGCWKGVVKTLVEAPAEKVAQADGRGVYMRGAGGCLSDEAILSRERRIE